MSLNNYLWATALLKAGYPDWRGIDEILGDAVRSYFPAGGVVLDVGCGKSSPVALYRSKARLTVGTDIDLGEIQSNHEFDALVASDGARLPFADGRFDLLLSKTAIEHMALPDEFFAGVHRVLKSGGVFIWATSNRQALPILVSRLTPLGLHRWIYRRLFGKSLQIEQFPTLYRANTERVIDRQLVSAGFRKLALRKASWPAYFAFSRPVFRLMLPVHRWLDRAGLQLLQVHLIGVYQKP
jgi:ubiquinone/menaquinone biosynthesis C-methylase UbiE